MKQLVMVDGPDFVGKTTFIQSMVKRIEERVPTVEHPALTVTHNRLLGGSPFSEMVRSYILNPDNPMDDFAALYIVLGANLNTLLTTVVDMFKTNDIVFLDRSFVSTIAYQTAQMMNHPLSSKYVYAALSENANLVNRASGRAMMHLKSLGIDITQVYLNGSDELLDSRIREIGDRFENSSETQSFTRAYYRKLINLLKEKPQLQKAYFPSDTQYLDQTRFTSFVFEYNDDGEFPETAESNLLTYLVNNAR